MACQPTQVVPFYLTGRAELDYEAYTVGIVCAQEFEISVVRYMLDIEHSRLPRKAGGSNLYILGELSGHNVALASLPGSQGKSAAAAVAMDMARTFPSIELRLTVGIGEGVPSAKNDIRLGDVVVSMPDGQHGGVVQYDLAKNTDDGIVLKGFLWPPPEVLRSAVVMMRSDHRISHSKIPDYMSAMFEKSDNLRDSYQRPRDPDELFQSEYRHVSQQATCQFCDKTRLVTRQHRKPIPKIHYGLVASGDQIIRNASNAAEVDGRVLGDILCFEMEAAGIATKSSCIAIRGISDYADSHKNDAWQYHAAAAAAGCAKELLSYVSLPQPFTTTKSSAGNPLATQSIFRGQGVQNAGSGNISVARDMNIGKN
jgi:nucleoside phosphorylase